MRCLDIDLIDSTGIRQDQECNIRQLCKLWLSIAAGLDGNMSLLISHCGLPTKPLLPHRIRPTEWKAGRISVPRAQDETNRLHHWKWHESSVNQNIWSNIYSKSCCVP